MYSDRVNTWLWVLLLFSVVLLVLVFTVPASKGYVSDCTESMARDISKWIVSDNATLTQQNTRITKLFSQLDELKKMSGNFTTTQNSLAYLQSSVNSLSDRFQKVEDTANAAQQIAQSINNSNGGKADESQFILLRNEITATQDTIRELQSQVSALRAALSSANITGGG